MTDPKRLVDDGNELEQTLLRAGRARAPGAARKRAVIAASAAAASTTTLASGAVAKGLSAAALKWIVVGVVVTAGTVTAVALRDHADAPAAPPLPAPSASPQPPPTHTEAPAEIPSVTASETPTTTPPPAPSTVVAPRPKAATPAASESNLRDEIASLDRARSAVASGDSKGALAALDAYDAKFPHGTMAPEAGVLRVEALLAAGDRPAAQRAAKTFLARYPESPHASRVRSLVGGDP